MFAKIFSQIFDSSISEDYLVRIVFTDLLTLSDRHGHVDITPEALSRRTNVPLEIVTRGLEKLSQPDPRSRSKAEDGRRIIPLDSRREWGWKIVNYEQYRDMRDENARRNYQRDLMKTKRGEQRQRKQRVKALAGVSTRKHSLASVSKREHLLAHVDVDVDTDKNSCPSDGRFTPFVDVLNSYWKFKNPEIPFSFGAADGKNLKLFLKDNPRIEVDHFKNVLRNRSNSEGVSHTDPIRKWITSAMQYASGPLDRFGKTTTNGNGNHAEVPAPPKLRSGREILKGQGIEI